MTSYLLPTCCLLLLSSSVGCLADDSKTTDELREIREELALLHTGQQQLASAVDAILAALSGHGGILPKGVPLDNLSTSTLHVPFRGNELASIGVLEFSDYQCPYCREHFERTLPVLEEKYIKNGKIRYFVRDFPLEPIHPQAERWAEATHCAEEMGHFWELRSSLFKNQSEGNMENALAAIPSSDRGAFDRCMMERRFEARVRDDVTEGKRLGVNGTPEFLIGYFDTNDPTELKCVRRLSGTVPVDDFQSAIESVVAVIELNEARARLAAAQDRPMSESGFRALLGKPVPAVRVDDLKRVWSFLVEQERASQTSVNVKLLEKLCPPNTNVMAVYFRSTLITTLLHQGRLGGRRDGKTRPDEKVFEVVANFPLPQGSEKVDVEALVAALK